MNSKYAKFVAGILAAWFIFSLTASALRVFEAGSQGPAIGVGLAAFMPPLVFLVWFGISPRLRQFVFSLNPRTLTLAQAWRVNGWIFLVLAAFGMLPGIFAQPAGWGDIAIGATAPLVAWKLATASHRTGFIVWQVLGIADLLMAVTLGASAALIDPSSVSTGIMTVLPLSLVPTFLVPLFLIFHIICISQARLWHASQTSHSKDELASSRA